MNDKITVGRTPWPESDSIETTTVPIDLLKEGDSPRLTGIDEEHATLLADSGADLPAVLVQRRTMRVIDGMHRLRAAQLRNRTELDVRFVDDDDETAFIRGVAENIAHGLPLTLADRKAAATRIMRHNPGWSNRAVAKAAGLSDKTVATIRRTSTTAPHVTRRKGRDGRFRPIDPTAARVHASELLAERPDASLREIAKAAGVSATTVRKIRDRMHEGSEPTGTIYHGEVTARPPIEPDTVSLLDKLSRDPTLRYSNSGRTLLGWLRARSTIPEADSLLTTLPAHCLPLVARLSRLYASYWENVAEFATKLARNDGM